jgi:hypothetical protein
MKTAQRGRFAKPLLLTCMPPIRVIADGRDQKVFGQSYDTISIAIVDGRTVRLIQKKNGQIDSDEKFTVAADGRTATDEFANWKITSRRLADAPPGSHVISGTWQPFMLESTSDRGLLTTFKLDRHTFSMSRPTGQSYNVKLDGPDASYTGEPRFNSVSVRRIDARTIEETDKFNDKVLVVSHMTLSVDGKTMTIMVKDLESRTTGQFTTRKNSHYGRSVPASSTVVTFLSHNSRQFWLATLPVHRRFAVPHLPSLLAERTKRA